MTAHYPADHRCATCGALTRPGHRAHGRCTPCGSYWRHHGTERPPGPVRSFRQYAGDHACSNCGVLTEPHGRAHGRCLPCAMYWRRRRQERPAFAATRACVHCGRAVPWGATYTHQRCGTCYWYRYRRGFDRPAALLARDQAPLVPRRSQRPSAPPSRPKQPGHGWRWTGTGWSPPWNYCQGFLDYGQKPLCEQCGDRIECQATAEWQQRWRAG